MNFLENVEKYGITPPPRRDFAETTLDENEDEFILLDIAKKYKGY